MRRAWPLTALTVLLLAMPVAPAGTLAAGVGNVAGTVLDPSGTPLEGVRLDLASPGAEATRVAHTDRAGRYDIAGLPPGIDYVLRVTHPEGSYATMVQDRIVVRPGATTREPFRLFDALIEHVEVRGDRLIDLRRSGGSTRLDGDYIRSLPLFCNF